MKHALSIHSGRPALVLVISVAVLTSAGCSDGGAFPLDLEVRDNGGAPGGKSDAIELVAKSIPDAQLRFGDETRTLDQSPTTTFAIPKSALKLGQNTFTVDGTAGVFLSKKAAHATATWDAPAKTFVRFFPGPADGESVLTCGGSMCGGTNFKVSRDGKIPIGAESAIDANLTVAGHKQHLAVGARQPVDVDLLALLPTWSLARRDTLTIPLVFEASGASASETLSLQGPALLDVLVKTLSQANSAKAGPAIVTFPGEAPKQGDPRSIAVLGVPSDKLMVVGNAATPAEFDLVAFATPVERFFSCGGAASSSAGILYNDLEFKTIDRRTGKVVDTRKLMADRVPCPPTPTAGQIKAEVRAADITRALGALLKKS